MIRILPEHEFSFRHYLKATGIQVGLLVNFKHQKATVKRMVLELPERHDALSGGQVDRLIVCVCLRGSAVSNNFCSYVMCLLFNI